jgi:hypothetical protein
MTGDVSSRVAASTSGKTRAALNAQKKFGGALLAERATQKVQLYPLLRRLDEPRLIPGDEDCALDQWSKEEPGRRIYHKDGKLYAAAIVFLLEHHHAFLMAMSIDESPQEKEDRFRVSQSETRAISPHLTPDQVDKLAIQRLDARGSEHGYPVGERKRWEDRCAQFEKECGGGFFTRRLSDDEKAARVRRWLREARRWTPKNRSGFDTAAFERRVLEAREARATR